MMKRTTHTLINLYSLTVLIFCACLLFSCGIKKANPEGILSKDEMAKVLTEFYLKESKITSLHLVQDSALVLFQYYKQKYAEEHNISDTVLEVSYQYYLSKPLELSEIYDRIIDSLVLKEQRASIPMKRPQ